MALLHTEMKHLLPGIREARGDDVRSEAPAFDGERGNSLAFPMISVNDAHSKYLFDNRYGTGSR